MMVRAFQGGCGVCLYPYVADPIRLLNVNKREGKQSGNKIGNVVVATFYNLPESLVSTLSYIGQSLPCLGDCNYLHTDYKKERTFIFHVFHFSTSSQVMEYFYQRVEMIPDDLFDIEAKNLPDTFNIEHLLAEAERHQRRMIQELVDAETALASQNEQVTCFKNRVEER